jgi:hypothetical protein
MNSGRKTYIFEILTGLVLFTLPLFDYSFVSKALIFWAAYGFYLIFSSNEKPVISRRNIKFFLILSLPFWLSLIWGFTEGDPKEASRIWLRNLPFLIIPAVFLFYRKKLPSLNRLNNWFVAGILTALLTAFAEALYIYAVSGTSYFYFDKLALLLNKHTTYFALFISIALTLDFYLVIQKEKSVKKRLPVWIILLLGLYFLSSRISLLALATGIILVSWNRIPAKKKIPFLGLMLVFLIPAYYLPAFQKRFHPARWDNISGNSVIHRLQVMKSAWQFYKENSPFTGYGIVKDRPGLYEIYRRNGLKQAAREKYNAHNQILENLILYGLAGSILIWWAWWNILYLFYKRRKHIAIAVFMIFMIFMLTESIWERQNGIIMWSFWLAYWIRKTEEDV